MLQALAMADTYAVVQKRKAPPSTRSEAAASSPEGGPVYSQVMTRARRPQAPAEDAQGALLGRGELEGRAGGWGGPDPPP